VQIVTGTSRVHKGVVVGTLGCDTHSVPRFRFYTRTVRAFWAAGVYSSRSVDAPTQSKGESPGAGCSRGSTDTVRLFFVVVVKGTCSGCRPGCPLDRGRAREPTKVPLDTNQSERRAKTNFSNWRCLECGMRTLQMRNGMSNHGSGSLYTYARPRLQHNKFDTK
jgi:hypothetical protein